MPTDETREHRGSSHWQHSSSKGGVTFTLTLDVLFLVLVQQMAHGTEWIVKATSQPARVFLCNRLLCRTPLPIRRRHSLSLTSPF